MNTLIRKPKQNHINRTGGSCFQNLFIIGLYLTSHSSLLQSPSPFCKVVWPVIRVDTISSPSSASYIPWAIILQDRRPKSFRWWMHALLEISLYSRPLRVACKAYKTNCDTTLRYFHCLSISNFQTFIFVPSFRRLLVFFALRHGA